MRRALLSLLLVLAACQKHEPPTPTAEQSDELNQTDRMLNDLANEEGPEQRSGPSNSSD